ncbi:MAG: CNNM domain-containing protein [Acidimicrobiales bacterium]
MVGPAFLVGAITSADITQGVVVVVLVALMLLLVTVESALTHTSPVRVEALAAEQPARTKRAAELLETPEALLNPLRLLTVIVQVAETVLVTVMAARWLSPWGVAVVAAVNMAVIFVIGEAVPRTLGILHSERMAVALARPVAAVATFFPVRWTAYGLIGLANVIVPGKGLRRGPFASPEELIALADAAVEDDVLEQTERDLIESVIVFGDTVVREVMVHRTDMTTVPKDVTVDEALEIASEHGYSRIPVVGESIDDVVGLVYVKDLIRAELDDNTEAPVGDMLRPAHFVPETKKVAELLREMQRDSFHMAVAVDEYGGIARTGHARRPDRGTRRRDRRRVH